MIPFILPFISAIPWKVVAAVAGLGALVLVGYFLGASGTRQQVIEHNLAAKAVADQARLSVDQCFDLGGSWDVVKGACNR